MKKKKDIREENGKLPENRNASVIFQVPNDYFNQLSQNISCQVSALPDFEYSPLIVAKTFSVPANYFNELPALITDRISETNSEKSLLKVIFNRRVLVPALLAAAMFIGGFFYFSRNQTFTINEQSCSIDELNNSQYLQSINQTDLIDFLSDQSTDKETDAFDQYLLDNDVDISQLEKNL